MAANKDLGDTVASSMNEIMESDDFKRLFSKAEKPCCFCKGSCDKECACKGKCPASCKKDHETDKDKSKADDCAMGCDGDMHDHSHEAKAVKEMLELLVKMADFQEELGMVHSAAATTAALETIVAELSGEFATDTDQKKTLENELTVEADADIPNLEQLNLRVEEATPYAEVSVPVEETYQEDIELTAMEKLDVLFKSAQDMLEDNDALTEGDLDALIYDIPEEDEDFEDEDVGSAVDFYTDIDNLGYGGPDLNLELPSPLSPEDDDYNPETSNALYERMEDEAVGPTHLLHSEDEDEFILPDLEPELELPDME